MESTKLLELTDHETAWEIMDNFGEPPDNQYAGSFGDNGGDPNGDAWYAEASDFPQKLIDLLVKENVARVFNGFSAEYNEHAVNEVMEQFFSGSWCGYGCNQKAFFENESDARLCQKTYDEMLNDDDLETIAGRVHAF